MLKIRKIINNVIRKNMGIKSSVLAYIRFSYLLSKYSFCNDPKNGGIPKNRKGIKIFKNNEIISNKIIENNFLFVKNYIMNIFNWSCAKDGRTKAT